LFLELKKVNPQGTISSFDQDLIPRPRFDSAGIHHSAGQVSSGDFIKGELSNEQNKRPTPNAKKQRDKNAAALPR